MKDKLPACLHSSSPLANLLRVSFLIDSPIDFFAVEGCVLCGLRKQIPSEKKLQANKKMSLGSI